MGAVQILFGLLCFLRLSDTSEIKTKQNNKKKTEKEKASKEKASKEKARRVWDGRKKASQYQPWGGALSGGDSLKLQAGRTW